LYTWGDNTRGRLGHGDADEDETEADRHIPTLVQKFAPLHQRSREFRAVFSVAERAEMTLTTERRVIGSDTRSQIAEELRRKRVQRESLKQKQKQNRAHQGVRIVSVACGSSHTAAVSGDGIAYTWGDGGDGRYTTDTIH
jgi:alpha-tubulin suppressor-like RCC1 family protein